MAASDRNRLLRRFLSALGALALLALVAPSLLLVVPQAVGGESADVVLTGSMEPAIHAGDLVVLRGYDPAADTVRVGDVIAFRSPERGAVLLHRVVAVQETDAGPAFTTRGDANGADDAAPVAPADVVGLYHLRVPHYGRLVAFARTGPGVLLFVVLPALTVLVREVVRIIRARRSSPADAAVASTRAAGGAR